MGGKNKVALENSKLWLTVSCLLDSTRVYTTLSEDFIVLFFFNKT